MGWREALPSDLLRDARMASQSRWQKPLLGHLNLPRTGRLVRRRAGPWASRAVWDTNGGSAVPTADGVGTSNPFVSAPSDLAGCRDGLARDLVGVCVALPWGLFRLPQRQWLARQIFFRGGEPCPQILGLTEGAREGTTWDRSLEWPQTTSE